MTNVMLDRKLLINLILVKQGIIFLIKFCVCSSQSSALTHIKCKNVKNDSLVCNTNICYKRIFQ